MIRNDDEKDDDLIEVVIKLDPVTLAWLCEIADLHHCAVDVTVGAILRDVRQDDQEAHQEQVPASNVIYLN